MMEDQDCMEVEPPIQDQQVIYFNRNSIKFENKNKILVTINHSSSPRQTKIKCWSLYCKLLTIYSYSLIKIIRVSPLQFSCALNLVLLKVIQISLEQKIYILINLDNNSTMSFRYTVFLLVLGALTQQQTTDSKIICPFAHFLSPSNTCVECLTSCSKCNTLLGPCADCSESFILNKSANKCDKCQPGWLWCSQNLKQCQPYYRLQNNVCKPVCYVKNCIKCDSISSKICAQCQKGYKLNQNNDSCLLITTNLGTRRLQQNRNVQQKQQKLMQLSQSNTNTNNSNNFPCNYDEYLDQNNSCIKCGANCKTCINSAQQCLQCKPGFMQEGWKCISGDHILYDLVLAVPKGQELFAVGQGLNEMKNDFIKLIMPDSNVGFQPLSITTAAYDNLTSRLNLSGIVNNIGNKSKQQFKNQVINKLKNANFFGPFALLNSKIQTPLSGVLTPPENRDTPEFLSPQKLAMILIPSIILGLVLFICCICCCCYCCKLCCFSKKKQKLGSIQVYDTERRPVVTQQQLNYEMQNKEFSPAPVPIVKQPNMVRQQANVIRKMPTMGSVTSINIGQPKFQNVAKPQMERNFLRQSEQLGLNTNLQKIVANGALQKLGTLRQSYVQDRQIRTVVPVSNSKIEAKRIENTDKLMEVASNKVVYLPIVLKQPIQKPIKKVERQKSNPEINNFHYINSKGEQIPIEDLADYLNNPKNLEALGIRSTKKAIQQFAD